MKTVRRRIISIALSVLLTFSLVSPSYAVGGGGGGGGGGGMGFFDGLDAFGNTTGTIGCILNVGSALANADWSDPGGVCLDLVDTIFGTSFGGDPMQEKLDAIYSDVSEIKETTQDIKNTVDYLKANSIYVNQQLSVITGSLKTVNQQLVRQTQMLSDITKSLKAMNEEMTASFNDLTNLINEQTETMISTVGRSTYEIKMTNDLHEALQGYVDEYSKLFTYDNSILETLSANEDFYTAFYNAVTALDNGTEIMEVLNKITLEEDSVASLSARERNLVESTYVKVGSKSYQVLKFHQDFVSSLMEFITGTGSDPTQSVYTLNNNVGNIGDTVLAMGDYLTASNSNFNTLSSSRGIGEMYYIYLTCSERDSTTVHQKYKAFMDSMVAQYMTTAWLAEMAYGYKITLEANGSNNASVIRNYEQYLNRIHAQMIKLYAYYDYEQKKCISDYDYGEDSSLHSEEVVYYGNVASNGVWNTAKKNTLMFPSGMSESEIDLALGEEFDLHYYYRYADVTKREDIVWSSSNPGVAAVDSRGEVLGLSRGVAKIKAEYMGTSAECLVSIGDVMAIANQDGVNRYHYHRYFSQGGEWVTDETPFFETTSERSYDYYYGVTTYLADPVELSESVRSASIAETTGMTDENMDAFTWVVTGDGAVQMNGYQISAVSAGWTEIIGYKKDDSNHTYDFIGIPVHSTMETVFDDSAGDYSDYTKISTKNDLIALANNPDGWTAGNKYVLTADIDLGGMEWNPIGYAFGLGDHSALSDYTVKSLGAGNKYSSYGITVPFQGVFDGNGHSISNFKITKIPRAGDIKAGYDGFFNEESGKTLRDEAKTLCLADLGLFGFTLNANITDLNVTDAVINIDTSKSTGVTLDGEEIPFDKTFTVFAGALTGAGYWDTMAAYYQYLESKYDTGSGALSEEQLEELYEDVKAPARFKEYYETFKADTESEASPEERYGAILMVYGLWKNAASRSEQGMRGCYATGRITISNGLEEGAAFAGMMAGGSTAGFEKCTALGVINASAAGGACGGLLGIQYAKSGVSIADCTIDTAVKGMGGMACGGLAGEVQGRFCFDLNDITFAETDTAKETENMCDNFQMMFLFSQLLGGTFEKLDKESLNTGISGNEVLGSVRGSGSTGGLIGFRTAQGDDINLMSVMQYDAASGKAAYIHYNTDIFGNYVACDVSSENGAAGGLIGLSNLKTQEGSESTPVTVNKGHISKNYYTGKVDGGAGNAAGLVGMVNNDYAELTQNISAATQIKGSGNTAYAINGRENGSPLVNGSGNEKNVAGAFVYNGAGTGIGDDHATQGSESEFNDPKTYTDILGDDCFLDLTGGLKEDGTVGLDLKAGLIPKKLQNRYRFAVETVPQSYHQGEKFVPVKAVYKYTGTGTELIKTGVESTTPDMTKIGVQTVTLTYGGFTDAYDVTIYPSAGFLGITEMPAVNKDGSGLSGGMLALYENGSAEGTPVSLSDCTVTRTEKDIFRIVYGKYTTALRPIYIDVFTNRIGSAQAEYVGSEFYAPGAAADVSGLIPAAREVDGVTYKLAGTSQEVSFNADGDLCILSYYADDTGSEDPDQRAADAVAALIAALPDADAVTAANLADVKTALLEAGEAYAALTEGQKKLLDPALLQKLADVEAKAAEVEAALLSDPEYIKEKIAALPAPEDVTRDNYADVLAQANQLLEAFNALDDASKDKISASEYMKLTAVKAAADEIAAAVEAEQKRVLKGDVYTVSSQRYKVTKAATSSAQGTVTFIKAKNAKTVTVPKTVKLRDGRTYKVTAVGAKAFTGSRIRYVVVSANVSKLMKYALKGSKAVRVTVKTKKLKKTTVRKSLSGSRVKTVLVRVGTKKTNRTYVTRYKKIFTKSNAGRKVAVK